MAAPARVPRSVYLAYPLHPTGNVAHAELDLAAPSSEPSSPQQPVIAARNAIYTLFELGDIDEERATAALLAVDAGVRRVQRRLAFAV